MYDVPSTAPEVKPGGPEKIPVPFDENILRFIQDRESVITDPDRRAVLDAIIREGAGRFFRFAGFTLSRILGEPIAEEQTGTDIHPGGSDHTVNGGIGRISMAVQLLGAKVIFPYENPMLDLSEDEYDRARTKIMQFQKNVVLRYALRAAKTFLDERARGRNIEEALQTSGVPPGAADVFQLEVVNRVRQMQAKMPDAFEATFNDLTS